MPNSASDLSARTDVTRFTFQRKRRSTVDTLASDLNDIGAFATNGGSAIAIATASVLHRHFLGLILHHKPTARRLAMAQAPT